LLHQLADGYDPFPGTLLLDDCDATFGKSRMNIKLQGLFTARFQQDARFTVRVKDDDEYIFDEKPVFFPAAFAGNGRLHPCLAERSILIALEPKACAKVSAEGEPGSPCQPFRFFAAQKQSRTLLETLREWGAGHHEALEAISPYKEDQFPPELSWRQRDCAEPLLHIADFIGGDWPQRARQALVNAFALAAFEDFYSSRQILANIRDLFAAKDNPEWIPTTDLLKFLHTLDDRNWHEWNKGKPMVPKQLAGLIEPFGIRPQSHRTGPDNETVIRGYRFEDLEPIWNHHLPPRSTVAANPQDLPTNDPELTPVLRCQPKGVRRQELRGSPVAANLQNSVRSNPGPVSGSQQPDSTGRWWPAAASYRSGKDPSVTVVAAKLQNHQATPNRDIQRDPVKNPEAPVAANAQDTSLPGHFAGPVRKKDIGHRIMTNQ
jgi:hypothetical protein